MRRNFDNANITRNVLAQSHPYMTQFKSKYELNEELNIYLQKIMPN